LRAALALRSESPASGRMLSPEGPVGKNDVGFRTYFSYSYRPEGRAINKHFWRLFAEKGYFFSVDPKSKDISVPYLESLMRGSHCLVAVVTYREEKPELFCSPFILFEYGMAVQARKPGLVSIDKQANVSCVPTRSDIVVERFDANRYGDNDYTTLFESRIADLTTRPSGYGDPDLSRSNKVGLVLSAPDVDTYWENCRARINRCIALGGFSDHIKDVSLHRRRSHEYALQLDDSEVINVDIDASRSYSWPFPYIYGPFIPTIKLYRLREGETPADARIPGLLLGIQSCSQQEAIAFWRHEDDLLEQIHYHLCQLKSERTEFSSDPAGNHCFASISRRPASVFVSNAASANLVAAELTKQFRAQNIQYFHYTEDAATRTEENLTSALQNRVQQSEIVVALINDDFAKSDWCRKEIEQALTGRSRVVLPYLLTDQVPDYLGHMQAQFLHARDVTRIVKDVNERLREPAQEILDTTRPRDERVNITLAMG
jgi:hypothetical protein